MLEVFQKLPQVVIKPQELEKVRNETTEKLINPINQSIEKRNEYLEKLHKESVNPRQISKLDESVVNFIDLLISLQILTNTDTNSKLKTSLCDEALDELKTRVESLFEQIPGEDRTSILNLFLHNSDPNKLIEDISLINENSDESNWQCLKYSLQSSSNINEFNEKLDNVINSQQDRENLKEFIRVKKIDYTNACFSRNISENEYLSFELAKEMIKTSQNLNEAINKVSNILRFSQEQTEDNIDSFISKTTKLDLRMENHQDFKENIITQYLLNSENFQYMNKHLD